VLGGGAQGGVTAGDEALEEGGRDGKGGRTLSRVEHAEATAGSRSDVEEAATLGEAICDGIDRLGDGGQFGGDGRSNSGVLAVDEGEHVERGELVDVFGCRVSGFGDQGCEVMHLVLMLAD
jgi:hypothetical protein